MFSANVAAVHYSDPWSVPLHERIRTLARGKYRIAYFYEQANNSTFRYRTYNMAQVLNDGNDTDISASYFFLSDLHLIDEIADLADVLVICRSRYCHRINHLITKFKVRGKRTLFDVDDLVFDPSYLHLIIETLGQDVDKSDVWDYWFAYASRMGETLRLCDGAITTNTYLAARLKESTGLPVSVVPNFINKEQLDISDALYWAKKASGFARNEKINLGYFSGSPSHALDYAIVLSALEEVLASDERVEVTVVGYIDAGSLSNRFGNRVKCEPFRDYVNLQRLIASVELNLMPLQSNIFTNCKSELKYFEAAIVGTQSIASPTHTYSGAIRDGENGYLAKAHQWASVIRRVISDIDNYAAVANEGYADARAKYAWFNQRNVILRALSLA
jgi:Glycosyl transferases group 1